MKKTTVFTLIFAIVSIQISTCSSASTNAGVCRDTPSWHNGWVGANGGLGWTCQEYVINGWCLNGAVVWGAEWTLGSAYKFPEKNCCVCGKQGTTPATTQPPAPEAPATNAGDCADTPSWHNGFDGPNDVPGFTCQEYVSHERCANGSVAPGSEWALGSPNNFPENNCCACGKQRSTPAATNAGVCGDTPSWHNGWAGANGGLGWTCQQYVVNGWCRDGAVVRGAEWTLGSTYKFPENNCCVCGKQGGG